MEKKMNNKGFSLVELIVVIAIMAVLVGVLAPQFIKYVEKSRQSTDIQNVDTIKSVIESYYSDKDNAPTTVTVTINGTNTTASDGTNSVDPGLSDAGVSKNKLKSSSWSAITMKYTTATGDWEYGYTQNGTKKLYYKISTDKTAFEVVE